MSGGVFVSPLLASEVLMSSCGFLINYGYVGSGRFKLIMVMSGGVSASPLLAYVLLRLLNKIWAVGYTKAFGHDRPDSSHFGLTLHLMHAIPLNKKVCTSSYVCLTSAAALVFLTIYPRLMWQLPSTTANFLKVILVLSLRSAEVQVSKCQAIPRAGLYLGFEVHVSAIRTDWHERYACLRNGSWHLCRLLQWLVMDTMERVWTFRYYTRPNGNRKYPIFTVGWLEFVRVKRLRVGDELTFYRHQVRDADGELQMQYGIQVMRTSNVAYQGEPISLDVENFL
ncbi:hypothetical protein LWI28_028254 [Acer negundo]|uniref:TF-B3 domain-containing protein n=1 Tax=Acer negundo TaxID=4023 RepID=A0AAD5J7D9_ACENE|nr:hypothetical protein LWI28_028254 [Acer negundo]